MEWIAKRKVFSEKRPANFQLFGTIREWLKIFNEHHHFNGVQCVKMMFCGYFYHNRFHSTFCHIKQSQVSVSRISSLKKMYNNKRRDERKMKHRSCCESSFAIMSNALKIIPLMQRKYESSGRFKWIWWFRKLQIKIVLNSFHSMWFSFAKVCWVSMLVARIGKVLQRIYELERHKKSRWRYSNGCDFARMIQLRMERNAWNFSFLRECLRIYFNFQFKICHSSWCRSWDSIGLDKCQHISHFRIAGELWLNAQCDCRMGFWFLFVRTSCIERITRACVI